MAPPIRTGSSPNEGSLLLAISAFKCGQFQSIRAAAKAYSVSQTTMRRRINGTPSRDEYRPNNTKLSKYEEQGLVQMILELDTQGLSPTPMHIRDMANSICKSRGGSPVGLNWATTFIQRTPGIETRLGRSYECQRKQCKDPVVIGDWFRLVENTINKHGILPEDIYNFDECGFQMGSITCSRVVTSSQRQGRPKQIKPTNTEWVTVIQGACTDGSVTPPFFILTGKVLCHSWFSLGLPSTWTFTTSANGWTTDCIGLQWLQFFIKHTEGKTVGAKRLLILDNHGSHTTPQFRQLAKDNNILLLFMPPHSSHILQPLDVGCFGPLKRAHSRQNEHLIRSSVFHVSKEDFLATF